MKKLTSHLVSFVALVIFGIASSVQASVLWVGHDTRSAVERIDSTSGTSLGYWGAGGATGTALDGAGHVYTVQPSGALSIITQYDAAQNPTGTINFTGGGGGLGSWIEDMTYGGNGTLWVSGYDGRVFNIDSAGTVLSSFNTGFTFTGIATDGEYLYTNEGFYGGDTIYQRLFDGTVVSTISTGYAGGAGIGWDASDNTLWVGYLAGTNDIRQFDMSGTLLSSLSIGGGAHDGLEVGDIYSEVPEPTSLILLAIGLIGLGFSTRKKATR